MKKYPFSVAKHRHDIELASTRAYNLIYDMEHGFRPSDDLELDRLYKVREDCQNILDQCYDYPVSMIDGAMIGRAKELIAWADCFRRERQTRI